MKKISRKAVLIGGMTAVAGAAGACLCTKAGWATISGVGATPAIAAEAYTIGGNGAVRIRLDEVPELGEVGGAVKMLDAKISDALIVVREAEDADC